MQNWNEIVQNSIIKHFNAVKRVTSPLRDHFGINYFTYHRIDKLGNYTVLLDRPDWAEHYVSRKFYLDDPYLRHPDVYESGVAFVDSFGSKEYKEVLFREGKKFFKADNALVVIEKSHDSVSFFGYTGANDSSNLQKLYLNHLPLLKSFQEHFVSTLQPIIRKIEEEPAKLLLLKGKDFTCKEPIRPTIEQASFTGFLQSLGVPRQHKALSRREEECLIYLLKGKTAKETAIAMGLSRRTIEYYFENIKDKLSLHTKQELFQWALKKMNCSI